MRFLQGARAGVVTAGFVAAVLALPSPVQAQAVVNPTKVQFTASSDQNTTAADGTPVLTRYDLSFYMVGAAQPFQTVSLGKPTPAADGTITLNLSQFTLPSPGIVYESRVAAVGPAGSSSSDPSNTFMFSVPCTYAASPTSATLAATGTGGTVGVTAGAGCTWTAQSNANWLTITAGASGTANGSVTYTSTVNTATTQRVGTLTVAGQTITVTQSGAACSYGVTPTNQSMAAAGGSGTLAVAAQGGCNWTASSGAGWVTIGTGATGSGNGSVTFNVSANTSTTSRSATLTVAGQPITISQVGAACSFGLAPATQSVPAAGGTASVSLAVGNSCTWTASSNGSWLRITSGGTGSGNGTIGLTADQNPSSSSRSASIAVGGQSVVVTQPGSPCSFGVTPTSQSMAAAAGSGTLAVTAGGGCNWTASSSAAWVNITSGATGTGNGSVAFSVAANAATTSRSATLTVAGQAITISQVGAACTFGVTPTSQSLPSDGGSGTLTVATGAGCNWTAASGAAWLTIASGASGSGNGSVNFSVPANTGTTARSATLTVAGQPITISQAAAACNYGVTPTSQTLPSAGGAATGSVTAGTGCTWSATSSATWLTISGGSNKSGNGSFTMNAAANNSRATRSATVTVAGQALTATQDAGSCTITISPTTQSVGNKNNQSDSVSVTAGTGCTWTATSNVPWITVSAGASGTGNGSVSFRSAKNATGAARTGTLTIGGQTETVTQPPQGTPGQPKGFKVVTNQD